MTNALTINNLSYIYRENWRIKNKLALQDISLDISEGETFGFLGHNGAGKTTTIKCILGLAKVSKGEIRVFGETSNTLKARKMIGYLPEQPYFYDHLTVLEAMHLFANLVEIPSSKIKQQVEEALERVRIDHKSSSPMRSLSKGLTQRVGMAQAILNNPKLLILDEPFSGLDPIGRKEFRELISSEKKNGTTIFMSTHVLSDVEALCDRASIMVDGKIRGIFALKEIASTATGTFELVTMTSNNLAQEISKEALSVKKEGEQTTLTFNSRVSAEKSLKACLEAGIHIGSYDFNYGSLEDLFVKLVSSTERSK